MSNKMDKVSPDEKSYKTPAYIRKSVSAYVERNRELCNERSKKYYADRKKNDPNFMEKVREQSRKSREKKKLKKLAEKEDLLNI